MAFISIIYCSMLVTSSVLYLQSDGVTSIQKLKRKIDRILNFILFPRTNHGSTELYNIHPDILK